MPQSPLLRRLLATGILLTSVIALSGCATAPINYRGTGEVIGAQPAEEDPEEELASGLTDEQYEEFIGDIDGAISVTDQYWSDHWGDFFTGQYSAPSIYGDNGLYDGYSSNVPECGGQELSPDNAFYCVPDDFVAWDLNLMVNGFADGDAWVYLVIAHEWGHAVQQRIDPSFVAEQEELQADCFAGAVLWGASEDGEFSIEDGDLAEITSALSRLADSTEWTGQGDHGDPFERIGAFDDGKEGGVTACFPAV